MHKETIEGKKTVYTDRERERGGEGGGGGGQVGFEPGTWHIISPRLLPVGN